MSLPSTTGNTGGQEILPVWASVWIGYGQPVHHTPTIPIGSVQEAARCQAFTGGYDRIQPMCWKVR